MDRRPQPPALKKNTADLPTRVHRGTLIVLQAIMAVELLLVFREGQWINAFLVMAIMAITAAGLRVGQDIGVVGFDDCDFAAVFGLTTVRQPVGRIAAHMISRLRAEDPADIGTVITPNLVCRRSTHRD